MEESRRPHRERAGWWRSRWLLGTVLGLAALAAAGVLVRNRVAVERDAQAARDALALGRADRARDPLARWLRARPTSAEAHALMAELALAEDQIGQVKPEFNQARSLGYPEAKLERI